MQNKNFKCLLWLVFFTVICVMLDVHIVNRMLRPLEPLFSANLLYHTRNDDKLELKNAFVPRIRGLEWPESMKKCLNTLPSVHSDWAANATASKVGFYSRCDTPGIAKIIANHLVFIDCPYERRYAISVDDGQTAPPHQLPVGMFRLKSRLYTIPVDVHNEQGPIWAYCVGSVDSKGTRRLLVEAHHQVTKFNDIDHFTSTGEKLNDFNVYHILLDAVSSRHFHRIFHQTLAFLRALNDTSDELGAELFDFERYNVIGSNSAPIQPIVWNGFDCSGSQQWTGHNSSELAFNCSDDPLESYFTNAGFYTATLTQMCIEDDDHSTPLTHFISQTTCREQFAAACPGRRRLAHVVNPPRFGCLNDIGAQQLLLSPSLRVNQPYTCDLVDRTTRFWTEFDEECNRKNVRRYLGGYLFAAHATSRSDAAAQIDLPLSRFLRGIDYRRSIVVLHADHGLHFGKHLLTREGDVEWKNPMLLFVVPRLNSTVAIRNSLRANQQNLVTAWDVHVTLKHLARPHSPAPTLKKAAFAHSLLVTNVGANRTCQEARVAPYFCLCSPWVVEKDVLGVCRRAVWQVVNETINRARGQTPNGDFQCRQILPPPIDNHHDNSSNSEMVEVVKCMRSEGGAIETGVYAYLRVEFRIDSVLFSAMLERIIDTDSMGNDGVWDFIFLNGNDHATLKFKDVDGMRVRFAHRLSAFSSALETVEMLSNSVSKQFCVL